MRTILILLLLTCSIEAKQLSLTTSGEAALIMNAKTGQVLFEKNGYKQTYPASTTKIGTALLAIKKGKEKLQMQITAEHESVASITPQAKKQSNYRSPAYWLETDSTHIGIKKGETLTLKDLLYGMMLASGNDAANVIAQGLGKTIPQYMEELNLYLKSIGCLHTHFTNPHGLHHPEHVTTPYDLALMTKEGLKDPLFRQIVSTVRYTCPRTNLEEERNLVQFNLLLRNGSKYYAKAIGVKTGTTSAAGKNLVAAATYEGREIIVAALGYRGQRAALYDDVIKMFEAAFNEPKMRRTLLPKGVQKLVTKVPGGRGLLKTHLAEALCYDFYPSEEVPVQLKAYWNIPSMPIHAGCCVGYVKVVDEEGTTLKELPLLALEDVKPTLWRSLTSIFSIGHLGSKLIFAAGFVVIALFLLSLRRRRAVR